MGCGTSSAETKLIAHLEQELEQERGQRTLLADQLQEKEKELAQLQSCPEVKSPVSSTPLQYRRKFSLTDVHCDAESLSGLASPTSSVGVGSLSAALPGAVSSSSTASKPKEENTVSIGSAETTLPPDDEGEPRSPLSGDVVSSSSSSSCVHAAVLQRRSTRSFTEVPPATLLDPASPKQVRKKVDFAEAAPADPWDIPSQPDAAPQSHSAPLELVMQPVAAVEEIAPERRSRRSSTEAWGGKSESNSLLWRRRATTDSAASSKEGGICSAAELRLAATKLPTLKCIEPESPKRILSTKRSRIEWENAFESIPETPNLCEAHPKVVA